MKIKREEKKVEATQESDVKPKKPSDLIFTHFAVKCSRRFKTVWCVVRGALAKSHGLLQTSCLKTIKRWRRCVIAPFTRWEWLKGRFMATQNARQVSTNVTGECTPTLLLRRALGVSVSLEATKRCAEEVKKRLWRFHHQLLYVHSKLTLQALVLFSKPDGTRSSYTAIKYSLLHNEICFHSTKSHN